MKYKEQLGNIAWILLLFSSPFGIGYTIGWNDGKKYARKTTLEWLEKVDSIHQQDSVKCNKATKLSRKLL